MKIQIILPFCNDIGELLQNMESDQGPSREVYKQVSNLKKKKYHSSEAASVLPLLFVPVPALSSYTLIFQHLAHTEMVVVGGWLLLLSMEMLIGCRESTGKEHFQRKKLEVWKTCKWLPKATGSVWHACARCWYCIWILPDKKTIRELHCAAMPTSVNIVSLDVIWVWKEKSSKMKCRIQQNRYKKKASSLPLRGKRFPSPSCWIHSDMGKCTPCLLQEAFAVACGTHLQWFVENTYINLVSSKCTAVIISFLFVWNTFNKINLFLFLPLPSLQAVHYFCLFIWVNDNLATTWTSI